MVSGSRQWSLYAGVYTFVVAVVLLLLPLGIIANTMLEILGIGSGVTTALLPTSIAGIGAAVWWAVVERRGRHSYVVGGLWGLLTALGSVVVWTVVIAAVYGPRAILAGGLVIGFVIAIVSPISVIAGLPLMVSRKRYI